MPRSSGSNRRRPLPHVAEQRAELSAEAHAELAERSAKEERRLLIRRLRVLAILFGIFIIVVLAQLVFTQVLNLSNRPQQVVAQAPDTSRGRIVDRDGVREPVPVVTGVTDLDRVEITGGLAEGDVVLVLPSSSLLETQERLQNFMRGRGGIPGITQRPAGGQP